MQALIIGAAGMVGAKLAASLADDPAGITALRLVDVVPPKAPAGPIPATTGTLDLTDAHAVAAEVAKRPEVIFHLAAIVSGEAEANFEKGYAVNFDGTRNLFEAIRAQPDYCPRVVFTSSIAVFGAPFPDDDRRRVPHRAADQLRHPEGHGRAPAQRLLPPRLPRRRRHPAAHHLHPPRRSQQGRLGLLLQHPARAARRQGSRAPGQRERPPLAREPPRRGRLPPPRHDHAHRARSAPAAASRMPGLSATVGEQIEALRRVAGDKAVALIRREPDATIARIVAGWPENFDAVARASPSASTADASFDAIIDAARGGRARRASSARRG